MMEWLGGFGLGILIGMVLHKYLSGITDVKEEVKDRWISAELTLPERWLPHFSEQSKEVLVVRGGQPQMAFYRFDRQGWFHPNFSLVELCGVTHWMPLLGSSISIGRHDEDTI